MSSATIGATATSYSRPNADAAASGFDGSVLDEYTGGGVYRVFGWQSQAAIPDAQVSWTCVSSQRRCG